MKLPLNDFFFPQIPNKDNLKRLSDIIVKKALNKHKKLVFKTLSLKIDSLFYFSIIEHKPSPAYSPQSSFSQVC